MPIRFSCPACRTPYTVPDADAGKKAECPVCRQRVQVPVPQRMKTVLGEEGPALVPPPAGAAPVLVPDTVAPPARTADRPRPVPPAYDPPPPPLPAYSGPAPGRMTGAGLGILAAAAVVLLVGCVVLVVVMAGRKARELEPVPVASERPRGERTTVPPASVRRPAAAPARPDPADDAPPSRMKGGRPGDPRLAVPPPVPPNVTGKVLTGDQVFLRLVHSAVLVHTPTASGTGFVVSAADGFIVTNDHVVGGDREVRVSFPAYSPDGKLVTDRREYDRLGADARVTGRVVAIDPACDLALIRVDHLPADSGPVVLAGDPAGPGDTVYSVGGSGAADNLLWRLTKGTVRGRVARKPKLESGRLDCVVLETDAPTNKGDSGGPVLNDRGELVGVVSHSMTTQERVSGNIDLEEVRKFVARHRP